MRSLVRIALGVSLLLVLPLSGPVLATEADCELSVTPTEGQPGTTFVFSGSGWTPTMLELIQEGKDPVVQELDLDGADPFEIELLATEAHAGIWTVIASIPETECAGQVEITVTLPGTATTVGSTQTPTDRSAILFALSGLFVLFLLTTRFLVPRFARRS